MEILLTFIDYFIHLDQHLAVFIEQFGGWIYLVLFLIIFCETGLVVTPILPGDSLLFALGAFAANPYLKGPLDVTYLIVLLSIAAILGDAVNYAIGKYVGPKVFHRDDVRFFKREYLDRTHAFYEKYGGKTIIIARFMPIIRTFAPFVAGIGSMTYIRFFSYNVIGGIGWITSLILAGYFFGAIPIVKNNFTIVIFTIILLSVLPGFIEFWKEHRRKSSNKP
jgi:membrane-associated protein